jgi:hypothetical protein
VRKTFFCSHICINATFQPRQARDKHSKNSFKLKKSPFCAGDNGLIEVWTKPLGEGRTAALLVNTADKTEGALATSSASVTAEGGEGGGGGGGGVVLEKCAPERLSQSWVLTEGGAKDALVTKATFA